MKERCPLVSPTSGDHAFKITCHPWPQIPLSPVTLWLLISSLCASVLMRQGPTGKSLLFSWKENFPLQKSLNRARFSHNLFSSIYDKHFYYSLVNSSNNVRQQIFQCLLYAGCGVRCCTNSGGERDVVSVLQGCQANCGMCSRSIKRGTVVEIMGEVPQGRSVWGGKLNTERRWKKVSYANNWERNIPRRRNSAV